MKFQAEQAYTQGQEHMNTHTHTHTVYHYERKQKTVHEKK